MCVCVCVHQKLQLVYEAENMEGEGGWVSVCLRGNVSGSGSPRSDSGKCQWLSGLKAVCGSGCRNRVELWATVCVPI